MTQKAKPNSKQPYSQPKLVEYGTVQEMTLQDVPSGDVDPGDGGNAPPPPPPPPIGSAGSILL